MKTTVCVPFLVAVLMSGAALLAQQQDKDKPVPKDSMRVYVPGCSKGMMFTAGPKSEDRPASVPEGMHLRMNGPKKVIEEIKKQEGSMIEITGLVRRGQFAESGVAVGGGVRISPAPSPSAGSLPAPGAGPVMIDVEGWRRVQGECRR